jgi:hypothetical protein
MPEFPPQFASSDLSSLLGQINDFAGVPPPDMPPPTEAHMMKKAKSAPTKSKAPAELAKLFGDGPFAVPVSIVGGAAQRGPYLPGLKDILIGVSYLRLAEQITVSSLKTKAQKQAYELIRTGNAALAEFVAKQT